MNLKPKVCVECGKDTEPWFSKKRCRSCAQKSYGKPKPVSEKRSSQLKDYSALRKEFLIKNPFCIFKFTGCMMAATEVHHTNGRENDRLNDQKYWKGVCRNCHQHGHNTLSAEEAIKAGFKTHDYTEE